MTTSREGLPSGRWHSHDFLIRVERGEEPADPVTSEPVETAGADPFVASSESPLELKFGSPSLASVSTDPELHERLSLLRSPALSAPHLINFAARNKSVWALDVLAGRLTGHRQDWAGLRAALINFSRTPQEFEPTLDKIKLDDLYSLVEALHERDLDSEAERSLLIFVADRLLRDGELKTVALETFIESLLMVGLGDQAGALFPRLGQESWLRYAIAAELEHPRFGGDFETMLRRLNEAYYRLGLERISLSGTGASPFDRLEAPASARFLAGPLVSVIITCHQPGAELQTAVASILGQTYGNWELIIIDDGSAQESPILGHVAGLDPRIRIVRTESGDGEYVRRNAAIQLAEGELVTFQGASDWSHPRRIELQVRDLLSAPARLANVVHGAKVSTDFSLFTTLGAEPTLLESSILFRREAVLDAIGYFDTTREGADVEFRQRLETATGTLVHALASDVPLGFLRVGPRIGSWGRAGKAVWTAPDLMAYRSSAHRFHERIRAGRSESKLPFPQDRRIVAAPPRLLGERSAGQQVDLLVVLDGHAPSWRVPFIENVVEELRAAISAGLRVALIHSESATGVRNVGPIAKSLQSMIDSGQVLQIVDDDQVEASVVVVRHAGAAQGHPAQRRQITTSRVVVVEDPAGGDVPGETVARADVRATVSSWFGVDPIWTVVRPTPPRPTVTSVVVDGETVAVRLTASDLEEISALRIGDGSATLELHTSLGDDTDEGGGAYLMGTASVSDLPTGDLALTAVRGGVGGAAALQTCFIPQRWLVTAPCEQLVLPTDESGLRVIGPNLDSDEIGSLEFYHRYLDAEVTRARIFREQFEVTVAGDNVEELTALYLFRNVNGRIRRRELVLEPSSDGRRRGVQRIPELVDVRWKVGGRFQTPFGPVDVPIGITEATETRDGADFRVRKLPDDEVLHVVPRTVEPAPTRTPELSVIMPVYNVGPYLDTAIRSVLTQDFENLELIIIDDASSDNGRRIIEMHRRLDRRVRVIELDHNTLGGAGIPSNLGIRAARGKYIAFVDSDDWVSKTGIKRLVMLAKQHDAEVTIGDFQLFSDDDRQLTSPLDSAAWLDIPTGEVISASTHPSLLRLSPVPWRKVYRRDFVEEHQVRFPEGDFFYEDNALHWIVLSRAQRIVASNEVVAYHRMEREGQTMGADAYKFAAIASHANTIQNALAESQDPHREVLYEAFIEYLRRQNWTVLRQTQPAAAAMLKRRFATVYDKAITTAPTASVRPEVRRHFEGFRDAYPDVDLTIVIPVYNCADYVSDTLDSVLKLRGLSYNVLLVDDGSTDNSLEILRRYEKAHSHVHVFTQKNRGAGRARNSVIPLVTGRYAFFVDADDVVDARALTRAVQQADHSASDLVFLKYRLDYVDEKRSRGMFDADVEIWNQLPGTTGNAERQRLLAGLINYPWNRLIRTALLHDANIFFGPTVVHNDMLFHWHSILSATKIDFVDAAVCAHRKFKTRTQVTNIVDERRMAVLEALRGTHQRITELEAYPQVQRVWQDFALSLLDWAKGRIPAELRDVYEERARRFAETLLERVDGGDPAGGVRGSVAPTQVNGTSPSTLPILT